MGNGSYRLNPTLPVRRRFWVNGRGILWVVWLMGKHPVKMAGINWYSTIFKNPAVSSGVRHAPGHRGRIVFRILWDFFLAKKTVGTRPRVKTKP